jgi:hypothetical protein
MIPRSIFIAQPAVAFDLLLRVCGETLNHPVTLNVDTTAKKLSDTERFLSILSAMRDTQAPVELSPNLLTHVSFSLLTVADSIDMIDILESCSGMSFTYAETKIRNTLIAVITGTMQQWRDAVVTGTKHQQSTIRGGFCQIHNLFVQAGLCAVWHDYEQSPMSDGTYKLIEYK